jgi:hypothetical protein
VSNGEHFSAAANRASVRMNAERDEMAQAVAAAMRPMLMELFQEARENDRAAMVSAVGEGFLRAFESALTEDNARRVFAAGVDVLAESATKRAGRWVLGGVGKAIAALRWPIVLLAGAYFIGGMPLLKTVWSLVWNRAQTGGG